MARPPVHTQEQQDKPSAMEARTDLGAGLWGSGLSSRHLLPGYPHLHPIPATRVLPISRGADQ